MNQKTGCRGLDLDKLQTMVRVVLESIPSEGYASYLTRSKVRNIISLALKSLPEHEKFLNTMDGFIESGSPTNDTLRSALFHVLEIMQIEKSSQEKVKELRFFESANEKLKQAGVSFESSDYPSVFHNLNTALELVLKDKLGIPMTISKVNTQNIIDVLVKHKIEPYLYLQEASKHVLSIANKVKHTAYQPTKTDCINGMKAMQDLIPRLEKADMKLTDEIKKKIYDEL